VIAHNDFSPERVRTRTTTFYSTPSTFNIVERAGELRTNRQDSHEKVSATLQPMTVRSLQAQKQDIPKLLRIIKRRKINADINASLLEEYC
jgi:hypothetical protein